MEETRPKVLTLYRAVLELLDAGVDMNTMKVSDITSQAGIGKGTAYDYFKSKEEMIAGAILWDVEQRGKIETEKLNAYEGFVPKIEYAFDWILNHFGEQKSFSRFLRLTSQPCEIRSSLLEKMQKNRSTECGPMLILRQICAEGRAEGRIRAEIPASAAAFMALASMASFVMYLENYRQIPEEEQKLPPEKMKEILCSGLLKQLE